MDCNADLTSLIDMLGDQSPLLPGDLGRRVAAGDGVMISFENSRPTPESFAQQR
jgi:hypothetical protein